MTPEILTMGCPSISFASSNSTSFTYCERPTSWIGLSSCCGTGTSPSDVPSTVIETRPDLLTAVSSRNGSVSEVAMTKNSPARRPLA
jgi:hypothetical protein